MDSIDYYNKYAAKEFEETSKSGYVRNHERIFKLSGGGRYDSGFGLRLRKRQPYSI